MRSGGLEDSHMQPLADALRVHASITHIGEGGLDLRHNQLGDEGWGVLFAGVCSSKASKIASINASRQRIGPEGAKLIAEAVRTWASTSLTQVLAFPLKRAPAPCVACSFAHHRFSCA